MEGKTHNQKALAMLATERQLTLDIAVTANNAVMALDTARREIAKLSPEAVQALSDLVERRTALVESINALSAFARGQQ